MRWNKGILAACIVAALAIAITIAGTASAAPGSAKAGKRCKKRHSARKKCKKTRADAPRSPLIRATVTWGNGGADDVDMDLFVFDANGNRAGNGSDMIRSLRSRRTSLDLREARHSRTACSRRRRLGTSASGSVTRSAARSTHRSRSPM